jgi:hypothetical protein
MAAAATGLCLVAVGFVAGCGGKSDQWVSQIYVQPDNALAYISAKGQ